MDRFQLFIDTGNPAALLSDADTGFAMESGDLSSPDTEMFDADGDGAPEADASAADIQRAKLRTHLDSVPYECESEEEMQAKLAHIVDKMTLCAQLCQWHLLPGWDEVLQ